MCLHLLILESGPDSSSLVLVVWLFLSDSCVELPQPSWVYVLAYSSSSWVSFLRDRGAFLPALSGSVPLPFQGKVSLSDESCPHPLLSWGKCKPYSEWSEWLCAWYILSLRGSQTLVGDRDPGYTLTAGEDLMSSQEWIFALISVLIISWSCLLVFSFVLCVDMWTINYDLLEDKYRMLSFLNLQSVCHKDSAE